MRPRYQRLQIVDRDLGRPIRRIALRTVSDASAPVLRGCIGRDLRRLLTVIALVRHVVLDDDLLQVAELCMNRRERLQRAEALLMALPDPDQDPARERDLELTG